jgi:hypothetical protein
VAVSVGLGVDVGVSVGVGVYVRFGVYVGVNVVGVGVRPQADKANPKDTIPLNFRKSRHDN